MLTELPNDSHIANRCTCAQGAGGGSPSSLRLRPGRLLWPLMGFAIPSLALGFGLVIPRSCIAGVNPLTVGYAATVAGACVTYLIGLRLALSLQNQRR